MDWLEKMAQNNEEKNTEKDKYTIDVRKDWLHLVSQKHILKWGSVGRSFIKEALSEGTREESRKPNQNGVS